MPNYEYQCPKCNTIQEITMKITISPIKPIKCPKCKSKMKRIISLCSFALKGPRWAKDGYNGK